VPVCQRTLDPCRQRHTHTACDLSVRTLVLVPERVFTQTALVRCKQWHTKAVELCRFAHSQRQCLAAFAARPTAQDDGGEMAAEGDREFERVLEWLHAADKGNAIQIAFWIRVSEVKRWWSEAIAQSERGDGEFHAAGGVHQMAEHRFVRAHAN